MTHRSGAPVVRHTLWPFWKPPVYDSEARSRQARLIHTFAIGILALCFASFLLIIFVDHELLDRTVMAVTPAALVFSTVLLLNRKGHQTAAAAVLVAGPLVVMTLLALDAGGIRSPGVQFFFVLAMVAALVLGERAGLLAGLACVLITLGLAIADSHLPRPTVHHNAWALWTINAMYVSCFLLSLRLGMRTLKEALARSETALTRHRKLERRLELTLESGNIGVWELDPRTGRNYGDARAFELFGLPMPADRLFPTETWWERIDPEDRPHIAAAAAALQRGESRVRTAYRYRRTDGVQRYMEVCASAIVDAEGRPEGSVGMVSDVTERRQAELERERLVAELDRHRRRLEDLVEQRTDELRRAKDAADQANRAKTVFLTNMSHEIRTPLNAVLGFAQLLLRDDHLTEQQRRQVETIDHAGDHLLSLIDGVLQLAKIEAGHQSLADAAFDLWALLDDVEDLFQPRAHDKDLRLAFERDERVPRFVRADAGKLRQVLTNLLSNALKFTVHGGVQVRLTVSAPLARCLIVEVTDTGPGIGPDEMPRVFEKFEQTETGRASGQGTGLGLAISRQLVRLMGGEIGVSSQRGRGTVFRFEVPIQTAGSEEVAPTPPSRQLPRLAAGTPARRVLVADDVEDNRELLGELLSAAGFETRSCADGAEALAVFQAWKPDLILMDVRMPVLDGLACIRLIRADPEGRAVKIICVTAGALEDKQRAAREAGADGFIRKPIRDAELFARVRTLLGVSYEGERGRERTPTPAMPVLTPEMTSRLPRVLRRKLRQATVSADLDQLLALADEAKSYDATGAVALRGLAEQYAYTRILDVLERTL